MRLFGCGLTIAAVAFGFIHLGLARRAGFGRGFSLCHGRIERQIGLHRRFGRARGLGGFHRGLCHRLRRRLRRGGGDDWHDNGGCDVRDDGRGVCALLTPLCPARLVVTAVIPARLVLAAGLIFATGLVVTTLLVVPARLILTAGLVALAAVTLRAVVVPVLAIAAVRIVVAILVVVPVLIVATVLIVAAILVITTVLVIATVLVIVARLVAIATVIPLTIAIAVIAARLLLRAGLWRFNQIVVLTASIDHLNRAGIVLHPIPAPFAAIVAVIAPGFAVAVAIPIPITVTVAVLATILVRLALLAALTLFLLGGHLTHRLTQEAGVMLGVLHEILSGNTVIRELGIPCEELILLDDLLWRAAHFPLRARAVEHAVDDVAE